ncbi:MAG TPA: response regulator [Terriglobales bacterium]|nr:response regulator [Terriglobales bacterium]
MKRILIVEDRATSRELLRSALKPQGYEVIEAVDGGDGLAKAKDQLPDLILLDLQMPKLGGFDVLQELRRDSRFLKTPIVAITASAMQGDREKALAAGFNGYLTKPVSLATLRAEISRLLDPGLSSYTSVPR